MKIIREKSVVSDLRMRKALLAAGLLLVLVTLFLVPPEDYPFFTCGFHALTGHSCLTCGMTRSLHAISHGELIASLRYHMMGPVIFFGVLLFSLVLSVEAMTGKRIILPASRKNTKHMLLLLAIIWLVYWGTRLTTEFVS